MIRRRDSRFSWLTVLLVVAVVVLAGIGVGLAGDIAAWHDGGGGGGGGGGGASRPAGAVTLTPNAVEAAVVPARTEAGARSSVHQSPGRTLLPLLGALVTVVGLAGVAGRRSDPPRTVGQPLRARRHAIALRAPPSPQLV